MSYPATAVQKRGYAPRPADGAGGPWELMESAAKCCGEAAALDPYDASGASSANRNEGIGSLNPRLLHILNHAGTVVWGGGGVRPVRRQRRTLCAGSTASSWLKPYRLTRVLQEPRQKGPQPSRASLNADGQVISEDVHREMRCVGWRDGWRQWGGAAEMATRAGTASRTRRHPGAWLS